MPFEARTPLTGCFFDAQGLNIMDARQHHSLYATRMTDNAIIRTAIYQKT
jgi:hypothetical protein